MKKKHSPYRFSGDIRFFKSNSDFLSARKNVEKKLHINISDWVDFEDKLTHILFSQSGLMPIISKDSPDLQSSIIEFLFARKRMIIFAGSPGNGKSLLLTEIRRQNEIISGLHTNLDSPLAIITWDSVHSILFEVLSARFGKTIPLPKGETHPAIRNIASSVMSDLAIWLYSLDSAPKVLVETPITGNRGDKLLFRAHEYGIYPQVMIMHSPDMEKEILNKGKRDVKTSGQPAAMEEMKAKILQTMIGEIKLPHHKSSNIVKNYWNMLLMGRHGSVIEWSPHTDREAFELTRREFIKNSTKADDVTPIHLTKVIKRRYEDIFDLMPEDEFKKILEFATVQ